MKRAFRLGRFKPDVEKDVRDELDFHIEMRARELMEEGMGEDEARARAEEAFGELQRIERDVASRDQSRHRRQNSWDTIESLMGDVRYALRTYRRSPGLTAVAILTLAVGLGAITSIFTFVNAFFLKPLPFHDAEALVMVWETRPPDEHLRSDRTMTVNPANYLDWTREAGSFSAMAAFNIDFATLTGDGDAEQVLGSVVVPGFFGVLGVQPAMGTPFSTEHGQPGLDNVAILSHGLWQRRYGGDPTIVGRSIVVDGGPVTVLGVMPADYRHPDPSAEFLNPEIWRPIALDLATVSRSSRWMRVVARLGPEVSPEQAQAEMTGIAGRLAAAYPETNEGWGANVVSLRDQQFASARPALLMLLGVGGMVLLIVCVNLANLFLARSHGRSREFAVRSAIGSGRKRIARQLLVEGVVVSAAGAALGILLTLLASGTLRNLQAQHFPSVADVGIDYRVVLFALVASTLTAVLFSLLPVFAVSKPELRKVLSEGGAGSGAGRHTMRAREWLVIGEIGLTAVLLFGAVLLTRSFLELTSVPTGFGIRSTLVFDVRLPRDRYVEAHETLAFYDEMLSRVEALPGVQAATIVSDLPFTPWNMYKGIRPEEMDPETEERPSVEFRTVKQDYFEVMGIPFLSGRGFTPEDRQDEPLVMVVNRELANLLWRQENPLGRRVEISLHQEMVMAAVVGVVGDILDDGLDSDPEPRFYLAYEQDPRPRGSVMVATAVAPMSLVAAVRREVGLIDALIPVTEVNTMENLVRESVATPRAVSTLAMAFGLLALLLAAVGIYGVMAYSVTERTREIGVRTALGAKAGDVTGMILARSLRMCLVGAVGGLVLALAFGQIVASLLFGVTPRDPVTFLLTFVVLGGVAILAAWVPAHQASRVDPMVAMRAE